MTTVPEPSREDPLVYGVYIAGPLAHCLTCHTPLGADRRPDLTRRFAGGRAFHGSHGTSYAANLTSDPETGLGAWSDAQVIQAISGIRPDGRVLLPPMPWPHYAGNIHPPDLQALLAYLRSLPPIANKVPPPVPPPQ